jgi:hypothetical protein
MNHGGAHIIARKEPNGSLKILAMGTHREIAQKWKSVKGKVMQANAVGEDAAGVGLITKQNSTKDVGPGSIRKNLKAFHLTDAAYEGNVGIMELFKFFAKAEKKSPELVAKVKELIKQKRDKEVWQIVQRETGTKLVGNEFSESIADTILRLADR